MMEAREEERLTTEDLKRMEEMCAWLLTLRDKHAFDPRAEALSAYNTGQLKVHFDRAYWSLFGLHSFLVDGGGQQEFEPAEKQAA